MFRIPLGVGSGQYAPAAAATWAAPTAVPAAVPTPVPRVSAAAAPSARMLAAGLSANVCLATRYINLHTGGPQGTP